MPLRLLSIKLLERVKMIFCLMSMKLVMVDFYLLRTNPSLKGILTDQYIKRDENGVVYTIVGKQDVYKMRQNFMV